MMLEEQDREKPTDFILRIMEDFGASEPVKVVLIFTDESGALQVSSNKLERSSVIGLLVEAQHLIIDSWLRGSEKS